MDNILKFNGKWRNYFGFQTISLELFNCKKIIEAHNGEICAHKSTDKGTAITFSIPVN